MDLPPPPREPRRRAACRAAAWSGGAACPPPRRSPAAPGRPSCRSCGPSCAAAAGTQAAHSVAAWARVRTSARLQAAVGTLASVEIKKKKY